MRDKQLAGSLRSLKNFTTTTLTSQPIEDVSTMSLVAILETNVDPKYYLSPRACAGILRRAAKRGRTLPEALRRALVIMATQAPEAMEAIT